MSATVCAQKRTTNYNLDICIQHHGRKDLKPLGLNERRLAPSVEGSTLRNQPTSGRETNIRA